MAQETPGKRAEQLTFPEVTLADSTNALPGGTKAIPARTGEGVHAEAVRILEEPRPASKEAQIYKLLGPTIQRAVAKGKFTKLQAAVIAQELGYPDIATLILRPTISIKTATETILTLIEKQQQTLLGNLRVLEDIASILLTRKEPELKAYLGILEPQEAPAAAPQPSVQRPVAIIHKIPTLPPHPAPASKPSSQKPKVIQIPEGYRIPLSEYIRNLELILPQLAARGELVVSHLIIICRLFGVEHLADRRTLNPDIEEAVTQVLQVIKKTKKKDVDPSINEYVDRVLDIPGTRPSLSQLAGITDNEKLPKKALILGGIASIQKEMLRMLEAESLGIAHVLGVCKLLHISMGMTEILRDTKGFLEILHTQVPTEQAEFEFSFDIQTYHKIMSLLSIDRHSDDLSRFTEKSPEGEGDMTTEMRAAELLQSIADTRKRMEIREKALKTLADRLQQTENQIRTKYPEYAEVLKNLRESITKPELVAQSLPRERILQSGTPLSGKLLEHRVRHEQGGKITHSFQLTLKKKELAFQMFTPAGNALLEGLQTYIRDVLYFGHGLLTAKEAKFLLEPLAEAFGEKCKFGLWERLMHKIRESKRTLGLGGRESM